MSAKLFMGTVSALVLAVTVIVMAIFPAMPEWSRIIIAVGAGLLGLAAIDALRLRA